MNIKNLAPALTIILFSCSIKPSTTDIMRELEGAYYYGDLTDDGILVVENCSLGSADMLTIKKENDAYAIVIENGETKSYMVQSASKNNIKIMIEALEDSTNGESKNKAPVIFTFTKGQYLEGSQQGNPFTLISVDSTHQFVYESCHEGIVDEDITNPTVVIDESTPEGQVLAEFLKLMNPDSSLATYFSGGHQISVSTPGPGVMPMINKIETEADLKTFLTSRFGDYSPALMAQWHYNKLFFYEALSDKCQPANAGVYISISTDSASRATTADVALVDNVSDALETQFILTFTWNDSSTLILSSINLTDCGA